MTDAEIIRAAAERVMGWEYCEGDMGPEWYDRKASTGTGQRIWHCDWRPLEHDGHAFMLVDKLAPLAGQWHAADGFFILQFGEYADHGESGSCTCGGLSEEDEGDDKRAWSAHFHLGTLSDGTYPPGWIHGARFCARASDRRRAIVIAALKAVGVEVGA